MFETNRYAEMIRALWLVALTCILLARVNVFGQVDGTEAALADGLAEPEIVGRPDFGRIGHHRMLCLLLLLLCGRTAILCGPCIVRRCIGGGIRAVGRGGFVAVMLLLLLPVVAGCRCGRLVRTGILAGAAQHKVLLHFQFGVVVFGEYRRLLIGHSWHRCCVVRIVVLQ